MTDSDRVAFVETMSALAAAFGIEPSEPWFAGYWLALSPLPLADVQAGAARALQTSRRMPVPAELRDLSGAQTTAAGALVAWETVRKAMRSIGSWESVDFGPLVNAVVRNLGGWQALCAQESTELDKWTRKDFERVYMLLAGGTLGISEERGKHLPGNHEISNGADGYAVAPPKLCPVPGHEAPKALPPMDPTPNKKQIATRRQA